MPRANTVMIVDVPLLWEFIAVRLARVDIKEQTLARQLGIAKQTLGSLHQAASTGTPYQPSSPVFLTLCWWLDEPAETFRKRAQIGPSMEKRAEPQSERRSREVVPGVLPVEPHHDRKCTHREARSSRHNPCHAVAVARVRGDYRCTRHLGEGVWLDAGLAWRWKLEPTSTKGEE